jgi:hypothetical protein
MSDQKELTPAEESYNTTLESYKTSIGKLNTVISRMGELFGDSVRTLLPSKFGDVNNIVVDSDMALQLLLVKLTDLMNILQEQHDVSVSVLDSLKQ